MTSGIASIQSYVGIYSESDNVFIITFDRIRICIGVTVRNFLHLTDPLLDGAVCKLGLREGRLPNAEVRGHQIKGGAGAS